MGRTKLRNWCSGVLVHQDLVYWCSGVPGAQGTGVLVYLVHKELLVPPNSLLLHLRLCKDIARGPKDLANRVT